MINTNIENRAIVGFFDNIDSANRAAAELEREGISRDRISIISNSDKYATGTGAAATGGLLSGLTTGGIPDNDAPYYAEGIRRGGIVMSVRANESSADLVSEIMDKNGARDIDERRHEWEKSGWTAPSATEGRRLAERDMKQGERAIPVVEETLNVGKREVGRKTVRVYSEMREQPVEEKVNLREEHVRVERRPADRPATEADFAAFREGTIELTETREEPVVSKDARVVEEVVVGKQVTDRTETVRDSVRKTKVRVEGADEGTREDHGYHFGSKYAEDPRYREHDWSAAEPHLRRDWESHGHGAWEEFKDSVRRGWDRIRGRR